MDKDMEYVADNLYQARKRKKEDGEWRMLCMIGGIFLVATVAILIGAVVASRAQYASDNMMVPVDVIVDDVVQIVTRYNQGLLHSKTNSISRDGILTTTFCIIFVTAAVLHYALAENPRLIDAIAVGLFTAFIVTTLIASNAQSQCQIRDIVDKPYETGLRCGGDGSQPISLRVLFEQLSPNVVSESMRKEELRRVIQRMVTLTARADVLGVAVCTPTLSTDQ